MKPVRIAAVVMVGVMALLQINFLVLEMFLFQTPTGLEIFGLTPEAAAANALMAKNQGLYNGFLAAGLLWGLTVGIVKGRAIITFFLICVAVAGLYGGLTAGKMILVVQMLPALIALALVWMAKESA